MNNQPQLMLRQAFIVAIDEKGGFAKDKKIPWHYPADFRWFQHQTKGHICVMGRNTYEEINQIIGEKGKTSVLPDRKCFVVSSTLDSLPNAKVIRKYEDIYTSGNITDEDHDTNRIIFTIGGGGMYEAALSRSDFGLVTVINKDHECDTFFNTVALEKLYKPNATFTTADSPDLRFIEWVRKNDRPQLNPQPVA